MVQSVFQERRGRITELDRSFDLAYWQAQPAEARFQATWELILHYARLKGLDLGSGGAQLRMQRSVETFQKQQRQLPDDRVLC